ncbi:KAP family P-loop NTPase fold protein [Delftia tsuruhatensis]|uniref:KAP family P-loop NTPase fold protein n=1 Tax=Delftia tsuruhatensis TaxID=180282 RepID=UPI0028968937|nr:P-loop NTPase fold protein [Delftia tsuruhatensis]
MWQDIEAEVDLLNFSLVANAAAQLIRDSDGAPLTIGVSGGWGTGKSSLVKMVGTLLATGDEVQRKYIFLEFNAWLYQGFDDARQALLEAVTDKLMAVAKEKQTFVDKVLALRHRVKWLKLGRMAAPAVVGMGTGAALGGPVGAIVGAVGGLINGAAGAAREEAIQTVTEAYKELHPELVGLLKDKKTESLPEELQALREAFVEILKKLDVTLVVLVDDLDRCLPKTAIATLEAMRLLLHVPHTAFIIAADEQMIRTAVRVHFQTEISSELVTSYFDKLIQVPLRVPKLGINEVKVYLMLLLADLAKRRKELPADAQAQAQRTLLAALKKAWSGGVTLGVLKAAYGPYADKIAASIDAADQLAPILVNADQIAANPRLIKRFLNNLIIRQAIAKAQEMTLSFDALVKMQLFERCASPAAFDALAKAVSEHDLGHPSFLKETEENASSGKPYVAPDPSWTGLPFYEQWIGLSPRLADIDLRPFIYLSRDKAPALASYDELSPQSRELFEATLKTDQVVDVLIGHYRNIGEIEADKVLTRLIRRARTENWAAGAVTRCFNVVEAHPAIAPSLVVALTEMAPPLRSMVFVSLIVGKAWATDLIRDWIAEKETPDQVRRFLQVKGRN